MLCCRYELALKCGLVEKVPDGGKEEDLDPVTLTYPAAYRTPADFRYVQASLTRFPR